VSRVRLRKVAPPESAASAICCLASDESVYTRGQCLDVDGGYAINRGLPGIGYERAPPS